MISACHSRATTRDRRIRGPGATACLQALGADLMPRLPIGLVRLRISVPPFRSAASREASPSNAIGVPMTDDAMATERPGKDDRDDIQGNLVGFNKDRQRLVFIQFP